MNKAEIRKRLIQLADYVELLRAQSVSILRTEGMGPEYKAVKAKLENAVMRQKRLESMYILT